jgi:hypothetical protein
MRHRARRTIGIIVATCALLVAASTAHAAWTVPTADPGAPPAFVQEVIDSGMLDPTPAEWSPQGTVIAQSGFDPQVDGFNFMNYTDSGESTPNLANTIFFDVPFEDPVNLTADDMRAMFGNEACTNRTGPCIPTLAAEATREAFNGAMDGGHCFGIAGTASQVFNGTLGLPFIGSAFRAPYRTPWSSTMTRTIARNFAWQLVNDSSSYALSPTQAVRALQAGLKPGAAPFVLTVWETPPAQGGHAITPIALYDRGNGLYDIEVWDNNYPGRTRAVHIDTTADGGKGTMEYLMFTSPGQAPTMASGDVGLIPADKLLGRQPCPFCDSAAGTTVTIDAVEIGDGGSVTATLEGLDGKAIADLTEFDAIDPPGDDMQTFPVWTVPANVPFRILLSTKNTNVTVTTAVTAQAGDGTWIASNLAIRPRSRDIVTINPGQESIVFSSTKGTDPTLAVIDTASANTMYQIEMRGIRLGANRAARLNLDFANNAAILTTNQRKSNRVNVAATLETATTEGTLYAWSYAPPQGYALVVDFAQWTAAAPTALDGWLADPDGERSELTWRTKVASPNSAVGKGYL